MAPLLSSLTLIRIHSATLLPIAYYLLVSPSHLSDQNLVFLLGEAMALPQPPSSLFSTSNPATALASLLAILLAVTDMTALVALEEELAIRWWSTAVLWRVVFFFAVVGASYVYGAGVAEGGGQALGSGGGVSSSKVKPVAAAWQGAVGNSLVFAWGFLELVFWFWVSRISLILRTPSELLRWRLWDPRFAGWASTRRNERYRPCQNPQLWQR